jgi:CheY-like chemotaxis protein
MQALFASWDATATGGSDAALAIAALADNHPPADAVDLIVADLRLAEGKSGVDAISRLRARLGSNTPAIIVSGDTSADAQAEVQAAGVKMLLKPVVAATLKEAAEGAILSRADASVGSRHAAPA